MDLWVLPPPSESQWFARIDWYLNWQLCKGLAFEKAKPSVELFRVLEEGDLHFEPHPSNPDWPLMVISQGRIPCTKCMVIAQTGGLKAWLMAVLGNAQKLNVQKMRIFLPKGSEKDEAEALWRTMNSEQNIFAEFCRDEDAL